MPFDINEFKEKFSTARQHALDKTNIELASEISSITRLTNEEILELFPETTDMEKLASLIEIVNSSAEQNTKVNQIVANAEKFGGIILSLVGKII
jgi:hypothetical protein